MSPSSRSTGAAARTAASKGCSSCSASRTPGRRCWPRALAMDKLKSKELFRLHNVPTAPYYVATKESLADLSEICTGASASPSSRSRAARARRSASRAPATSLSSGGLRARARPRQSRAHRAVRPRHGGARRRPRRPPLGAIEVVPKSGVYDYASKYTPGATDYICPPRLGRTAPPRRDEPRGAGRALPRLRRRLPRRPPRNRGRERVRPRGQHAPGHDEDVASAQDRGLGGHRLRLALRVES